jgi:AbiV family abortive infection protein
VLAAFAREELGKSILLRELRDRMLAGDNLTTEAIAKEIRDHSAKQTAAVLSITQHFSRDDEIGKLIQAQMEHKPGTTEYRMAELRLQRIRDAQAAAYPKDRHKIRMDCLYVDQNDKGNKWKRPSEQSQNDARDFLNHAVNDYSGEYDRVERGNYPPNLAEFMQTKKAWKDRPSPPSPEWPHT